MISPSLAQFKELAAQGNVVPVYQELPADLETPLSVFLKLRSQGPSFLLESVEKGESVGRYSFLGTAPTPLLKVVGEQVHYADEEGKPQVAALGDKDPLAWLQELMGRYRAVQVPGLPLFWGGAVGYLGYDLVRRFEPVGPGRPADVELPEVCMLLSRQSVLFDHVAQKMLLVLAVPASGDLERAYADACQELTELAGRVRRPLQYSPPEAPAQPEDKDERFNRTREDYEAAVLSAKEHIAAGDIFQVVLSQRYSRRTWTDTVTLYRALRLLNPSPYMVLLDLEDFQLIGSSPEMLVKLEGQVAECRPIAGTRRRSNDPAADAALEKDLLADPKERAEHVMLVDLGRNDLGRVCRYGSVEVPQFMQVERYSHVMHLVSSVRGDLREGATGFDLVRAAFPAGTVSGAPKIRAMQIIDELEPTRRGPYAGCAGYFSFWGTLDTCITIRTMVKVGDRVYLQAGAGLVADSDPAAEYDETLAKLAALRQAIEVAESELFAPLKGVAAL